MDHNKSTQLLDKCKKTIKELQKDLEFLNN